MPANNDSRYAASLAITRRQSEHDHTVMSIVLKYIKARPNANMSDVCRHLYLENVPTPRHFGLTGDLLGQVVNKWSDRILRRIIERNGVTKRRGRHEWTVTQAATDRFA